MYMHFNWVDLMVYELYFSKASQAKSIIGGKQKKP